MSDVKKIFDIAEMKGLRTRDLSQKLGVPTSRISGMKSRGGSVNLKTFKELCEVVGLEVVLEDKDTGLRYKL